MKFVVACDSFKGCMTSKEVGQTIEKGILKANFQHRVKVFSMADGGEGTAQAFCDVINGKMVDVNTLDAYHRKIRAGICLSQEEDIAIIDVASCIGLSMVDKKYRNPMITSSKGVGILIKQALSFGVSKIIIGLGGSSTNDGGMGLLSEFGVRFYDSNRELLRPNTYALGKIAFIDKRAFSIPSNVEFIVACDVKNHLLGQEGATYIFGKQKGIYENQMEEIDSWLRHYRDKLDQTFHVDVNEFEASGAAGGIGAVLLGMFHARMVPGIQLLTEYAHLEDEISKCDIVITGEGQTDRQTVYGKVPYGIAQLAKKYDKPVICLSGALGLGYEELYKEGVIGIFSSADRAMSFQTALKTASAKLEALAFSVVRLIEGVIKYEENK